MRQSIVATYLMLIFAQLLIIGWKPSLKTSLSISLTPRVLSERKYPRTTTSTLSKPLCSNPKSTVGTRTAAKKKQGSITLRWLSWQRQNMPEEKKTPAVRRKKRQTTLRSSSEWGHGSTTPCCWVQGQFAKPSKASQRSCLCISIELQLLHGHSGGFCGTRSLKLTAF